MNMDLALDRLDEYLSSDDSPEDCFMLSDLDGFLHGIACSPVFIPADEWMSVVLGADPTTVPHWAVELIGTLYMDLASGLALDEPVCEPMFWQAPEGHVIAMDWCEGFMQAVSLRHEAWLRLTESGTHGHLIMPILVHILDESGSSPLEIPQDQINQVLDDAAEAIPTSVINIFRYWRQQ